LFSFERKRFITLAKMTPPAVATINERAPRMKIRIDSGERKTSACVEAPTVRPRMMVTISMSELRAVSANGALHRFL
jgi:hypothetical protein